MSLKLKRSHFKRNAKTFCFENIAKTCPITRKPFEIAPEKLEKYVYGKISRRKQCCNQCHRVLYVEKKIKKEISPFFAIKFGATSPN